MLLQRRKMSITDNLSRSHDSGPELVIIFLRHASDGVVELANSDPFSREIWFDHGAHSPFKICLTNSVAHGSLRDFLTDAYVENLQHYRIKSHARQRDSSPRYGQEKGGRRTTRHQKCAAHFRAKPARTPNLGSGTEEIYPHPRDGARPENNKQERRLQGAQESRRYLIAADLGGSRAPSRDANVCGSAA